MLNFTIKTEDIKNVLLGVSGITKLQSNLCITDNVLIKTNDNTVSIFATNLETGFTGIYPAEIKGAGVIAVNAKKLSDIVVSFPDEKISFREIENRWFSITDEAMSVSYHLIGINADDFPRQPPYQTETSVFVCSNSLKRMFQQMMTITGAKNDYRAHVCGIHLKTENNRLVAKSTDGNRINIGYCDINNGEAESFNPCILSKRGLRDLARFFSGDVKIGTVASHLFFECGTERMYSLLLDGDFPQTEIFLIVDSYNTAMFAVPEILALLNRANIVISSEHKGCQLNFEEGKLTVKSENPEIGSFKQSIKTEYVGEPVEIVVNLAYIIDFLKVIDDDMVAFKINDGRSAIGLFGINNENLKGYVMPMRV